jgi:hypothetical protein
MDSGKQNKLNIPVFNYLVFFHAETDNISTFLKRSYDVIVPLYSTCPVSIICEPTYGFSENSECTSCQ